MGNKSKIEWLARPGTVPATWNPIRARNLETGKVGWYCEHVTPGCLKCYAARWNMARGNGLDFLVRNRDKVAIFLDANMLTKPLRWRDPHTIFPCSMTDLFADFVTDEMLDQMFAVMALTQRHIYIVTTKRPDRMRAYLMTPGRFERIREASAHLNWFVDSPGDLPFMRGQWGARLPFPNIWLGVSVCDGGPVDKGFMNTLARTPAALRWVSYEPALGFMDLTPWMKDIRFLVYGGESGSTRANDTEWALFNMREAKERQVAFFVKQLGRRVVHRGIDLKLEHTKGADMSEWPEELRVREFPQ